MTKKVEHVHCSNCGKRVSGVDPELGLVVRAWVECPECIEKSEGNSAKSEGNISDIGPPGRWICPTCGFVLTKAILRASDGAVGVDASPVQDICQNDGSSLRQVTWKEDAEDANRVGLEKMKRADVAEAKIVLLRNWVNDLQAGMYVNCVYCGHRHGPNDEVAVSMADVLKEHIEQCPEHPLSALRALVTTLLENNGGTACGIEDSPDTYVLVRIEDFTALVEVSRKNTGT